MPPIPSRADGTYGIARCRIIHLAATIVTTSMSGASISSADRVPTRGTTHRNARLYEQAEIFRAELEQRLIDLEQAQKELREVQQGRDIS